MEGRRRAPAIPGESLPRWAFGCYWRKDGLPIGQKYELIAEEAANRQHTNEHSARFIAALSARRGADPQWIMPGFEDPFHHVWKERRLPTNVDPHKADLKKDDGRAAGTTYRCPWMWSRWRIEPAPGPAHSPRMVVVSK